jgi:eukaryotic-like serine/threonine-protein kinase
MMLESLDRIGRYELTAEVGRGSMGVVHRARDPVMDRDVAIKTVALPHGLPEDKRDEFQARFLREAQAAGRLSHPGIVAVFDYDNGATTGRAFIAMEFVDGPTLQELISRCGRLDPQWVLSLGEALAAALQVAHDAGVVHRDLKPANILIRDADGGAKITDFGVAHIDSSELTVAGLVYGSPAYIAPERLRGERADARSDLFSLGVILYEALCGEKPFGGNDFTSTCLAIITQPTAPVHERHPELSPAFDRFFARALAKNPDERYPDAAAFGNALKALRDEQKWFGRGEATGPIRVAAPSAITPGRIAVALLLAGIVVLGIVGLRATRRPEQVVAPLPEQVAVSPSKEPTARAPAPAPASARAPARAPARSAVRAVRTPALPAAPPAASATAQDARLELKIKSFVKAGTLDLLLDGKSVYTTTLARREAAAPPTGVKKLVRRARQELGQTLRLPPGAHQLVAHLTVEGNSRSFEQNLDLDLEPGTERSLSVVLGKALGPRISLLLEPVTPP